MSIWDTLSKQQFPRSERARKGGGYIPGNPAQAAAWQTEWQAKHAHRWVPSGDIGKGPGGSALLEPAEAQPSGRDECVFFTIIARRPT